TVHKAGFQSVVIGLSGGIDSSVSAVLCSQALGKQNVFGVAMPYTNSHPDSMTHAQLLAETFDIALQTVSISQMVDSYFEQFDPNASMLRRGNFMARQRMCVLYDLSAKTQSLVAGTSNKSEIYAGYCTQYGDSACAFEPFAHLYKSEIIQLADLLKIPEAIIRKDPTADFWEGQTDESEMRVTYKVLDEILHCLLDEKIGKEALLTKGFSEDDIDNVIGKITHSEYKRQLPPQLKI
ncbi:MAG: NAD+ synthase, partial [Candidatus Cloacimonetes bacterium]|nr:NAD+ synthase [Candidatus Cloacimonadota bacterium]